MSNAKSTDTLVALDIGTSKVLCLVADIDDKGDLRIIGIEMSHAQASIKASFQRLTLQYLVSEEPKRKRALCPHAIYSL